MWCTVALVASDQTSLCWYSRQMLKSCHHVWSVIFRACGSFRSDPNCTHVFNSAVFFEFVFQTSDCQPRCTIQYSWVHVRCICTAFPDFRYLELHYAVRRDVTCSVLLLHGLFYYGFVSLAEQRWVLHWLVNDEFAKIWKEAAVA
jgi:hypothetical protein